MHPQYPQAKPNIDARPDVSCSSVGVPPGINASNPSDATVNGLRSALDTPAAGAPGKGKAAAVEAAALEAAVSEGWPQAAAQAPAHPKTGTDPKKSADGGKR
jgi:hypothetical protein